MHVQSFTSIPPHFIKGDFAPVDLAAIMRETPVLSCAPEAARQLGGPLTCVALDQIERIYGKNIELAKKAGLSAVVDSRVHRLMPGQYPSVPGWHCDAVPRSGYHAQPDFSIINPAAFHVCVMLSNEQKGVSNTEFVQTLIKPKIWDEEHVYKDLHIQVERIHPDTVYAQDGVFTWFTPKTIHRASPCARRGVRWWMRFSMYHKPSIQNKVQGQQQIYQLSEANGW